MKKFIIENNEIVEIEVISQEITLHGSPFYQFKENASGLIHTFCYDTYKEAKNVLDLQIENLLKDKTKEIEKLQAEVKNLQEIKKFERSPKQVIVVRKDLNMRKGKLAAQVAHASLKVILDRLEIEHDFGDYYEGVIKFTDKNFKEWLMDKFTKIVVSCDDEKTLFEIEKKCFKNNIPSALIKDAGLTEFKEPTFTCIAVGPADPDEIDKITGDFPLL